MQALCPFCNEIFSETPITLVLRPRTPARVPDSDPPSTQRKLHASSSYSAVYTAVTELNVDDTDLFLNMKEGDHSMNIRLELLGVIESVERNS